MDLRYLGASLVANLSAMQETQETWFDPWIGMEEGMATHSSIVHGGSHGQRSLAGYSLWGHKESGTTEAT